MIRLLLYGIIIILIVRIIRSIFYTSISPKQNITSTKEQKTKKVKKDVGEYVDYEEIK